MNVEVLAQENFDFFVVEHTNAHLEKSGFLLEEPFAQLFVSAIGESANKVRNVVV